MYCMFSSHCKVTPKTIVSNGAIEMTEKKKKVQVKEKKKIH